jgi:hypothetical protein
MRFDKDKSCKICDEHELSFPPQNFSKMFPLGNLPSTFLQGGS